MDRRRLSGNQESHSHCGTRSVKGERGERGKKGHRGEKGDTGATGSVGPTGPPGSGSGGIGMTGPTGPVRSYWPSGCSGTRGYSWRYRGQWKRRTYRS